MTAFAGECEIGRPIVLRARDLDIDRLRQWRSDACRGRGQRSKSLKEKVSISSKAAVTWRTPALFRG
jgi:hypothetical protein